MIELKNISLQVKHTLILEEVSVSFSKGACYGLVGRNGSGKSMLFKAIAGFIPLKEGQILIDGHSQRTDAFPHFGTLIESPNFVSNLTALQNLRCLAEIQKIIELPEIHAVLELVGLADAKNKKYKHFSLGMKQRLRIAQAIMEDPDHYILDEPFNGLDEQGVQDVYAIIQGLKQKNKTILLTSHDPQDISMLCDKIYQIKGGKLIVTK